MNSDIFRYKCSFITFALLLGYTFLHIELTGLYSELSLDGLMNFSVRLPYAQRLLVPGLARLLSMLLPLKSGELFFLMEWLFVTLFYFALRRLLQEEFSPRQAQLFSWLSILLLPLITVVNYRFQSQGAAAVYSPSDTASLFFIVLGFLFCLRKEWGYFIPWVFLATLNRESSILLVFIIPALHWQNRKMILKPMFLAILAYLFARLLVLEFLSGVQGQLMEWYLQGGLSTHFADNLIWLLNDQNILLFSFCFAGLSLLWFAFFDYIPERYRPLRYVVLCYFLGLLLIGRFMEARIFSEIVALLYFPVCLALRNWVAGLEPVYPVNPGFSYYFNRYSVLCALMATVMLRQPLNQLVIWIAG
ncbi:hypothetical protein BN59_00472 [Legionella massiliensis]|uniref:Uncharacterized protein n=1 Tax=Legionella massiliensis TaxID=1034943 RepID=A0A078KP87_9GAMM|nr:hypothetical protein [Legionella massiliensis]CDZ76205.1 hypothetical protein BN59_00472 [Legionella massiliensis]CEE11943.1 hypothetical protein BN1094_00472 [Legionella massiliensis]